MSPLELEMPRKTTSQKPQGKALNMRLPADLHDALLDGERVLALLAAASHEDAPDFSKALRRFMRIGLDVTFAKVGGRPQSESDWVALEATLLAPKSH